jgi:cytochrome c oxidase subunit IV
MSSHHHHHVSEQELYEGDQSALYSGVLQHHMAPESPESKKQVKKIWSVFWILLAITLIEVCMGMFLSHSLPKGLVVFFLLAMTVLKAGYIVSVFMHLGDEMKSFIMSVLIPLVLFVWFIIAFLSDGNYWLYINSNTSTRPNSGQVQKP